MALTVFTRPVSKKNLDLPVQSVKHLRDQLQR